MTYQEVIQQVGKQIDPVVYFYDENGKKVTISRDNFEIAKPKFNAKLLGTVMKSLEIELKVVLPNVAIYLDVTASFNGNSAAKTYGPYYFKELPTYNADSKTYTHMLYDEFIKTMTEYKPINITYPCTIYNFYKKIVETLGLKSDVSSFINGHLTMENDIYEGINFTYRDVLEDIAQANGVLLEMDGQVVKVAELGTEEKKTLIDDDILKNTNIGFGEHFGPINTIVLSRSADSDSIYLDDSGAVEINGRKELKISDNQLMNNNNRSDFLPALLEKLKGTEYDIFDTELVGYGGFAPLQKVVFSTGENEYHSFVFNNEIEITQGYKEVVYTDMPEESTTNYKAMDKTDKTTNQLYIIANKQAKKIEALASEVDENSEKTVKLEMDVNGIQASVKKLETFTNTVENGTQIFISDASEYKTIRLEVQG